MIYDLDVIVIGCDAAGLTAAHSVLEQRDGARVVVLERAPSAHFGRTPVEHIDALTRGARATIDWLASAHGIQTGRPPQASTTGFGASRPTRDRTDQKHW